VTSNAPSALGAIYTCPICRGKAHDMRINERIVCGLAFARMKPPQRCGEGDQGYRRDLAP